MTSARTVSSIIDVKRNYACPPDKSISVRAVILCGCADGISVVENLSLCDDVMSAVDCMRRLGAKIELDGNTAVIHGGKLKKRAKLDCGNSATAARLLIGLLSGMDGQFVIDGDDSLRSRPMARVTLPLEKMGARIVSQNGRLPITLTGGNLRGIDYCLPVSSAQVKSAVLLGGLNADGKTSVTENVKTRDHTENMLIHMGAAVNINGNTVSVYKSGLKAVDITVSGDTSAAAYPICLALAKNKRCVIKNVGINDTRIGYIRLLKDIGANINFINTVGGKEPYSDIQVGESGKLRPFVIDGDTVPRVIDEIPVLCALGCFIDGVSVVSGASELRIKESDRITSTVRALKSLGADIDETHDGIIVRGGKPLAFGNVDAMGDHRIAMSAAVAAAAGSGAYITGADCVSVSYPTFFEEVTA